MKLRLTGVNYTIVIPLDHLARRSQYGKREKLWLRHVVTHLNLGFQGPSLVNQADNMAINPHQGNIGSHAIRILAKTVQREGTREFINVLQEHIRMHNPLILASVGIYIIRTWFKEQSNIPLALVLSHLAKELIKWIRDIFGNLFNHKCYICARFEGM
ncbi:hypothetical protein Cgig2_003174 [Carnegiea gigantea]|uniref:Uncharacterized protein n=1 Tax=Carnegiea gigantea TaxID=171969 RepID=A0A9Q1K3J8_9CARY|nr:hypothetical protein Cgig2_003174 [Carnegiea gigantea]